MFHPVPEEWLDVGRERLVDVERNRQNFILVSPCVVHHPLSRRLSNISSIVMAAPTRAKTYGLPTHLIAEGDRRISPDEKTLWAN